MAEGSNRGNLGTFKGVFTPSILTILGIILFLRIAYVVGSAGILMALLIIIAANAISVLTSLGNISLDQKSRVTSGGRPHFRREDVSKVGKVARPKRFELLTF